MPYLIGTTNSVTVFLDDDHSPQYQVADLRNSSVYNQRAAIIEIRRLGRASAVLKLPFEVYLNASQRNYTYLASGDVETNSTGYPPTNVLFAAYSSVARLNLSAPNAFPGYVEVLFPSLGTNRHPVWYASFTNLLDIAITQTNAMEGTSQRAAILLSRVSTSGLLEMTVYFTLSGPTTPSGLAGQHLYPDGRKD